MTNSATWAVEVELGSGAKCFSRSQSCCSEQIRRTPVVSEHISLDLNQIITGENVSSQTGGSAIKGKYRNS